MGLPASVVYSEQVITAMSALMTLIVAGRFAMRYQRSTGFGMDDWLILAAMVFNWGAYAFEERMLLHGGAGYSVEHLERNDLQAINRLYLDLFIIEYIYTSALTLTKFSILCKYTRLFPTAFVRRASLAIGATMFAWWFGMMLAITFQCHPVVKAWTPFMTAGTCFNLYSFYIGCAVPNIATDFAILSLPVAEIVKLRMRVPQKLGLVLVLVLRLVVPIASIVRIVLLAGLAAEGSPAETTLAIPALCIWSQLETTLGPISVSLPALRPILAWALRTVGLSGPGSSAGRKSSGHNIMTIGSGGGGSRKQREKLGSRGGTDGEDESNSIKRMHGAAIAVTSERGQGPAESYGKADKIPLRTISVRTEIQVQREGSAR